MPPLKHALLKIRILTTPHIRLRQVALRVLSLDRKHRLHPHLPTLLTLHTAFEVRLQSFQIAFSHTAQHLPDDIFHLVLTQISHLPRVLCDITDGLNAIANVLSTPSFKGLPARYLTRLHAFCVHYRMSLRTLDCVMNLLRKSFPLELHHHDENDPLLRGLLDIISAPATDKLHLAVEASLPRKMPLNRAPFYTAAIHHALVGVTRHDMADRICCALSDRDILTWVIAPDSDHRKTPPDLKDVVLETADIGIFILSPESLQQDNMMSELRRFMERCREDQSVFSRRPILVPLYSRIAGEDVRRVRGPSWEREIAAFDPMYLRNETESTLQQIVARVVAGWESMMNPGANVVKKPM